MCDRWLRDSLDRVRVAGLSTQDLAEGHQIRTLVVPSSNHEMPGLFVTGGIQLSTLLNSGRGVTQIVLCCPLLGPQVNVVASTSQQRHLALVEVLERLKRVYPLMAEPVVLRLTFLNFHKLLPLLDLHNRVVFSLLPLHLLPLFHGQRPLVALAVGGTLTLRQQWILGLDGTKVARRRGNL